MSTAASDLRGGLPPPPPPPPPGPPALGDTASMPSPVWPSTPTSSRGVTEISDRAARSLAMAAAAEVDGVTGAGATGGISVFLPETLASAPSVGAKASVHDRDVTLDLTIGVEYPRPVRATLEALARHLAERMRDYGGLRLERLDVTVAELCPPAAPRRTRVQ